MNQNFFALFFLLTTWICFTQSQINPNLDDETQEVLTTSIDERFKNEPYYYDLSYLNSNYTTYESFQNKFAVRDRPGASTNKSTCQQIRQVPPNVRNDLKLAYFYQKYTEAYGIPVIGSNKVSATGLKRACYILRFYLANNMELREHFYKRNVRVVVMASSESLSSVPEYSSLPPMYSNLRGLSATPFFPLITVGEENVQCSINDKLKNDDLLFHQFSYSVLSMNAFNLKQKNQLETSYSKAKKSNRNSFGLADSKEFFARSVDTYLNINGKKDEEFNELDSLILNLIQQIFMCNNVYSSKCKSTRENQVLKLGKNCELENQITHEAATTKSTNNDIIESLINEANIRQTANNQKSSNYQTMNFPNTIATSTEKLKGTKASKSSNSDCNDINENCESWALKGECQRNKQFMSIECKSSCNFCKDSSTKSSIKTKTTTQADLSVYESLCRDEFAHCPVFASRGDCKTNPHHMLDKCKRSCNLCGDLVEQKDRIQLTSKKPPHRRPSSDVVYNIIDKPTSTNPTTTESTTTKASTTVYKYFSQANTCKDLASHCNELAQRGDCLSNKETMSYYCPYSCKIC